MICSTGVESGLQPFIPIDGIAFDGVDDKDASVFPALIPGPLGQPAIALVHRPLFPGTRPEEKVRQSASRSMDTHRESIWISYCRVSAKGEEHHLGEFVAHHRLACPAAAWERLKIGGGAPPVMCRHGWLMIYHGVHDIPRTGPEPGASCAIQPARWCYRRSIRTRIIYRSPEPVLVPEGPLECHRYGRQRRVSHGHRSSRRSWRARSLRHLLRHGGRSNWRGASGRARNITRLVAADYLK